MKLEQQVCSIDNAKKLCEKCSTPMQSGWDSYIDIFWYQCQPCNIFYKCTRYGTKYDITNIIP
jgi:hypothetical protein